MGPDYTNTAFQIKNGQLIPAIRELRAVTHLGLKEAKDVVDRVHRQVKVTTTLADIIDMIDVEVGNYPSPPQEYAIQHDYSVNQDTAAVIIAELLRELIAAVKEGNALLKDALFEREP